MKFYKIGLACFVCLCMFLSASFMIACGNKATVRFDTRGGGDLESELITRGSTFGEDDVLLPTPFRVGYSFEGWFYDANCTSGNEFYSNSQVNRNMTIHAKWAQNAHMGANLVTIILKDYYGSGHDYSFTAQIGSEVTFPTPNANGDLVFTGFYYDEDKTHVCPSVIVVEEGLTAYTGWDTKKEDLPNPTPITPSGDSGEKQTIHVTFDLQYPHPFHGQTYSVVFNEIIPLGYISRAYPRYELDTDGKYYQYEFVGWGKNSNSTTGIIDDAAVEACTNTCWTEQEEDCSWRKHLIEDKETYYAYWTKGAQVGSATSISNDKVQVTLHANYPTADPKVFSFAILNKKSKIFKLDEPSRTGYLFGGWYFDEECTEKFIIPVNGREIDADLDLYAKWTANPAGTNQFVSINYYNDGDFTFERFVKYTKITALPILFDTERAFIGWFTDKAQTKRFTIEDSFTMSTPLVLYAKWHNFKVGDVTQDGSVTNEDVALLTTYLKNKNRTYTQDDLALCDVNRDGVVDRFDVHALNVFINNNVTLMPATSVIMANFDLDKNGVVNDVDFEQYRAQVSDIATQLNNYNGKLDFNNDGSIDNIDDAIFSHIKVHDTNLKNTIG